ncbi:hypothetical protein HY991_01680, partial [Candidatus Micrarchaeota archaeon]|nr:hypothetical protein [Candidatus Micrarchaeota archaeon]
CISECGAFELYCASKLVELGCDFAFVGNKKEGKLSGVKNESVRIGSVGRLMEAAGKIMGGSGGGHENVGGAKGKKEKVEKALDACVKMVEEEIGKEEKNAVKIKRY